MHYTVQKIDSCVSSVNNQYLADRTNGDRLAQSLGLEGPWSWSWDLSLAAK